MRRSDYLRQLVENDLECAGIASTRCMRKSEKRVGIGYDSTGRLLEVVTVRNGADDWLVKHAHRCLCERAVQMGPLKN